MKSWLALLITLFLFTVASGQAIFTTPDTVCVNTPVKITNTTVNASSYYWNFCVGNLNNPPTAQNLGNIGGMMNAPVFMDYVFANNKYYAFVSNYYGGNLIRLDFGNSLLNTPTAFNLGNFGGMIPVVEGSEGIQVIQNEGKWYAIIVGGYPPKGYTPRVLKIEFGNNIENPAPVATNWGNIGNMLEPIDLHVFKEGSNWYGLVVNAENNSITRLNFTSSFDNIPTGTNLGNIGNLSYPTGIYAIEHQGEWKVFVTNGGNNTTTSGTFSLSRLDFGSSLLNTPTGVNLGNPDNRLKHPRDLTILRSCGQVVGFAVNGMPGSSDLVKFDFRNDLNSIPSIVSLGNFGHLSFPHSISKIFRVEDDLFAFVTNVRTNSISRLRFSGCTNSSIPTSTQKDPPDIIYNSPGVYNINLTVNEGLATQSSFCRNVVVVPAPAPAPTALLNICKGDSIKTGPDREFSSITWNTGQTGDSIVLKSPGKYWADMTFFGCSVADSFAISELALPVTNLGGDTTICANKTLNLKAGSHSSYVWQNGSTTAEYLVSSSGKYHVTVTSPDGCRNSDTIQVNYSTPNADFSFLQDNCVPELARFNTTAANLKSVTWKFGYPVATGIGNNIEHTYPSTGGYFVRMIIENSFSCFDSTDRRIELVKLTRDLITQPDTSICKGATIELTAAAGTAYRWYPADGLTSLNARITTAGNDKSNTYFVDVTDVNGCRFTDSIKISIQDKPVFSIMGDTAICKGESLTLKATGGDLYNWNNADQLNDPTMPEPQAVPGTTTTFTVVASNHKCNADSTMSVIVTVNPSPILTLSKSNDITCTQNTSVLNVTGAREYLWSPADKLNDPRSSSPTARISVPTLFHVAGMNEFGCQSGDSISINMNIEEQLPMAVPNAFTPNNDGVNECFGVRKWGEMPLDVFNIYNRFGQVVFSSNNALHCWDGTFNGKKQEPGTYVYYIRARTACGLVEKKGTFLLIR